MIDVQLVTGSIDTAALIAAAGNPDAGAVACFVGTARRTSSMGPSGDVTRLEYEAYAPMAVKELESIAREACERHDVIHLAVHHRLGVLAIGDAAVVIVVSTAHRAAAFEACREVIERIKERVPIWKKEVF